MTEITKTDGEHRERQLLLQVKSDLKRWVLSNDLKVDGLEQSRTCLGRAIQREGAAMEKAPSPPGAVLGPGWSAVARWSVVVEQVCGVGRGLVMEGFVGEEEQLEVYHNQQQVDAVFWRGITVQPPRPVALGRIIRLAIKWSVSLLMEPFPTASLSQGPLSVSGSLRTQSRAGIVENKLPM